MTTFGEVVGFTLGGTITAVIMISIWRCCCGDNNFWRVVDWCRKKSSDKAEDEAVTPTVSGSPLVSTNINVVHVENVIKNQPTVTPSTSDQTARPSAPPEHNNETSPLLLQQPNLTSAAAISDQPDSQTSLTNSNQPQQQSTATVNPQLSTSQTNSKKLHQQSTGGVVPESTPSGSMVITADFHQGSEPQSGTSAVTTNHSSAKSDEVDSSQPQQQSTVPTVNPHAGASWTNSYQLQQQSTEQVFMPPSSTSGCVASQPTNKRSFSAKFVGDLGKILNPPSPVDKDWRLILMELGQSHGEIVNVTGMSNPTEEALRRWQEAGRSLDDLFEVYKEKRQDVCECIENSKKKNEAYSAIAAENVQQTPRHGDTIVTTDQLTKLAHNLASWDELATNLGMSKGDIFKFKAGNRYSEWAQVYYMLDKWKSREYSNATVGLLYKKCCETSTIDKEMYAFLLD